MSIASLNSLLNPNAQLLWIMCGRVIQSSGPLPNADASGAAEAQPASKAEVSGFQRQRERRVAEARGPGHSGIDLRSNAQYADAERLNAA